MIGDIVFGQPPLATVPKLPHVERGWIKKCKPSSGWVKRDKNNVSTNECGYSAFTGHKGRA